MEQQKHINKDLILRERLAIERTQMANDTTLLAFMRTSLYFSIAGMSVNRLLNVSYGKLVEMIFWGTAILIIVVGTYKFRKQKLSLKNSQKHIGDYKLS